MFGPVFLTYFFVYGIKSINAIDAIIKGNEGSACVIPDREFDLNAMAYSETLKLRQLYQGCVSATHSSHPRLVFNRENVKIVWGKNQNMSLELENMAPNEVLVTELATGRHILLASACIENSHPKYSLKLLNSAGSSETLSKCTLDMNGHTLNIAAVGGLPYFR